MAERILVIEDDHELGKQIVVHLRQAGYQPIWWPDGLALEAEAPPDVALVILDLMLPGTSGLDLLRLLRAASSVPVLVLSARVDTSDKVRALKLGADDYMPKPFWPEELIERVRARLRRPILARADVIVVGPLRIDRDARAVEIEARAIEVTAAEFDLLWALARRPGAAITRASLVEGVLGRDPIEDDRLLDVHVSRLRKKLGAAVIETVWGIGYRLRAEPKG